MLQSGFWRSLGLSEEEPTCPDDRDATADGGKAAVSYCRFPSLLPCILQSNIFPFYQPKYSWEIRAQGILSPQNLGDFVETLASLTVCFLAGPVSVVASCLSGMGIATPIWTTPPHVALCYTISIAHKGRRRHILSIQRTAREGRKQGDDIPKINFHLQASCIFNRERLNIIG